MKNWKVLIALFLLPCAGFAETGDKGTGSTIGKAIFDKQAGMFSLGARNTINMFTDEPQMLGKGAGGSFRIQIGEHLNTEWFLDVINSNLYNRANRTDAHIGWNVMLYPFDTKGFTRKITPFLAAGHCFDYTGIRPNGENQQKTGKWTSAVQMSIGSHYNFTPRFDITLSSLYDLHLGHEVEAKLNSENTVVVDKYSNAAWEGHIMLILSVNYKLGKLWTPKA